MLSLISIQYFITLISSMGEIFYLKMPLIIIVSEMSGIMMGKWCMSSTTSDNAICKIVFALQHFHRRFICVDEAMKYGCMLEVH